MADGDHTFTCVGCGAVFTAKTAGRKFCTAACHHKNGPRIQAETVLPTVPCRCCGAPIRPKATRLGKPRTAFCSRKCANFVMIQRGLVSVRVRFSHCHVCGHLFRPTNPSRLTCSDSCNEERKHKLYSLKASRSCLGCGVAFIGSKELKGSRHCSTACRARHIKAVRAAANKRNQGQKRRYESYKIGKRIYKARRKAIAKGRMAERIDPIKVFEEEGWACGICGIPTPPELRGSYEHNAPELDHIIPFSRGGHHLRSNVRCACRACNGLKGGQMDHELEQALAA